MGINGKVCISLFIETSTKLQQKSMFYGSVIKQKIKYVIFNIRIYSVSTNPYISIFIPKMRVYKCPQLSQTPTLDSPQVTINMIYKTKVNKNSKFKPPIVQWFIPICNAL